MMRVLAFAGDWLLIECEEVWLFYDTQTGERIEVDRKIHPNQAISAMTGWGYHELREPMQIESLEEIDMERVKAGKLDG